MSGQSYPPVSRLNSQAGLASIRAGIPTARLAASRKHDREVAAKALRDAATVLFRENVVAGVANPTSEFRRLSDRADAIEAGEVDL